MKVKSIIILPCFLLPCFLFSQLTQGSFLDDQVTGKQYQIMKISEYEGSQFLFDDWKLATVIMDSSSFFKEVPLLFDIHNKLLYFKKGESTFLFYKPILQFELSIDENDPSRKMVFRSINYDNGKKKTQEYAQLLAEGKWHLLKSFDKKIDEIYEYNNPVALKKFRDVHSYRVFVDNKSYLIENIPKEAQSVLSSIHPSVTEFVRQNGKIKTEDDLIRVVRHVNDQK